MPAELLPDSGGWHRPPDGGYTADDLDRIPGLPRHTELIDGSLVLVSPQKRFHVVALRILENALVQQAPPDLFRVAREMSVVLNPRQRLEPDIMVIHAGAEIGVTETWYPAAAVVLTVEVVSPDSQVRDRERKPELYAEAGIRYFWRVESPDDKAVIYAYELDPATGKYVAFGVFRERAQLPVPFPIDIDLRGIG